MLAGSGLACRGDVKERYADRLSAIVAARIAGLPRRPRWRRRLADHGAWNGRRLRAGRRGWVLPSTGCCAGSPRVAEEVRAAGHLPPHAGYQDLSGRWLLRIPGARAEPRRPP